MIITEMWSDPGKLTRQVEALKPRVTGQGGKMLEFHVRVLTLLTVAYSQLGSARSLLCISLSHAGRQPLAARLHSIMKC